MAYDQDYRFGLKSYGYTPCYCSAMLCTCHPNLRSDCMTRLLSESNSDRDPLRIREYKEPRVKDWEQRERRGGRLVR